ncbi:MAG: SDR family NAD(P)-dependent oxidoreductase [Inquilinus sp.]|nr:SDR family NAD(P)-dependent oxidoreductase [Inquilinus sp.]
MSGETWLVLGGSSAIARAFAREAAAGGDAVLLAGRDLDDLKRTAADIAIRHGVAAEAVAFDARKDKTHKKFMAACSRKAKGTLNLFLAFAEMPEQAAMETDFALARGAIETTYLGAASVLSAAAPLFEAQAGGRIVVLGSVAGDRGRLKNYVYGSAKAGLHAFVQGLRARLSRAGVTVTTIKPGFVDTAMTWGQPGLFLVASPEACARACLRHAKRGAEVRYVPWFWWGIMAIIKAIPERIFKRLSI